MSYNPTIDERIRINIAAVYCGHGAMTVESIAEMTEKLMLEHNKDMFSDIDGAKKFFSENRDSNGNYKYLGYDDNHCIAERDPERVYDNVMSIIKMDMEKFMAYPEVPVEPKQDEIPAFEEPASVAVEDATIEVDGDTTNNFAKIDLGTGLEFDPDHINQEMAQQFDPSNPARFFMQNNQQPQMIAPPPPIQMIPPQMGFIPQMPVMPQMPTMIPPQMIPNIQQIPQKPVHRVDEMPKPPKVETPADNVDHNLEKIHIDGLMKPPVIKEIPNYITPIPQAPAIQEEPVNNRYDNSGIINKFNKIPLFQIQTIANRYGCSVEFTEYPHEGLISVSTIDHRNWQPVYAKSFVIDSGMIIDKRAKLIATNPIFNPELMLENAPMFELFMTDAKNHGRKILDEKLINDIFMAGIINISKKEMYTEKYKKLNTKLALISLPTKGLNKEERNALQDYIIKMDDDGYLDSAINMSPNSRFVFITKQLDKDKLSDFALVNQGVPKFYGTNPFPVIPIIIESKGGQITIKSGSETQI